MGGEPRALSLAGGLRVCCLGLRVQLEDMAPRQPPAGWVPAWFLGGAHRPASQSNPHTSSRCEEFGSVFRTASWV